MFRKIMKNLYGVNNIEGLIKRLREQVIKRLFACTKIGISMLMLILSLTSCSPKEESILIYQDHNRLMVTREIGTGNKEELRETEIGEIGTRNKEELAENKTSDIAKVLNREDDSIEYFDDVIDYTYDDSSGTLFVLHSQRSHNTDEIGYRAALEEGLSVGGYIRVYQMPKTISKQPDLLYENDFTKVNPWSIDVGDFEQDGIKELFVACYRATEFYETSRRPFVIWWDGDKFFKKWTGSYIGFDSFLKGEIKDSNKDGYDELVLYVLNKSGQVEERAYKWGNFTFDRLDY